MTSSTDGNGGNGRISVSEDRLRAVILEFELRLREYLDDKLLHKADVIHLTDARKDIIALRRDVNSLQQWRSYVLGAVALGLLLASTAVTFTAIALTNH